MLSIRRSKNWDQWMSSKHGHRHRWGRPPPPNKFKLSAKKFFFPKSGSVSVSAYKKNPIRSVDEFQSHRQKSLRLPGLLLWTNLALSSFAQSWFCSRAATTTTTMTWPLNLNTSDEYEGIIIIDLWPMLLSLYCNKTRFSNYSC